MKKLVVHLHAIVASNSVVKKLEVVCANNLQSIRIA
jgi:hypothetical protein